MIKLLVESVENLFYKLGKQIIILDRNQDGTQSARPYLVRTIIAQNSWFCIYIHRFLVSDHETFHDHPWNFFTYVVSGEYTEHRIVSLHSANLKLSETKGVIVPFLKPFIISRKAGSLAYREQYDIHRVVVDRERTLEELKDAPLTVCFIGPRKRVWGFWKQVSEQNSAYRKFVPWNKFLKMPEGQENHYIKRKAK